MFETILYVSKYYVSIEIYTQYLKKYYFLKIVVAFQSIWRRDISVNRILGILNRFGSFNVKLTILNQINGSILNIMFRCFDFDFCHEK